MIDKKNLIAAAAALLFAGPALAYTDEIHGISLQLDNRVTIGSAWRTESRDPDRIGIANGGNAYSTNGDDGDLAFDAGKIVSAAAKITSDLTLTKGK